MMVVLSQNGMMVIESRQIHKMIGLNTQIIAAVSGSNCGEKMAVYDDIRQTQFALLMYASSLAADEQLFSFPPKHEVADKLVPVRQGSAGGGGEAWGQLKRSSRLSG